MRHRISGGIAQLGAARPVAGGSVDELAAAVAPAGQRQGGAAGVAGAAHHRVGPAGRRRDSEVPVPLRRHGRVGPSAVGAQQVGRGRAMGVPPGPSGARWRVGHHQAAAVDRAAAVDHVRRSHGVSLQRARGAGEPVLGRGAAHRDQGQVGAAPAVPAVADVGPDHPLVLTAEQAVLMLGAPGPGGEPVGAVREPEFDHVVAEPTGGVQYHRVPALRLGAEPVVPQRPDGGARHGLAPRALHPRGGGVAGQRQVVAVERGAVPDQVRVVQPAAVEGVHRRDGVGAGTRHPEGIARSLHGGPRALRAVGAPKLRRAAAALRREDVVLGGPPSRGANGTTRWVTAPASSTATSRPSARATRNPAPSTSRVTPPGTAAGTPSGAAT